MDARFCGGCGVRLDAVCAACQAPNPRGNRFCHRCGVALEPGPVAGQFASPQADTPRHLAEKILTTGSAPAGERKQVTVLFVDVSGFTSLSERLDPEEVHRIMSRAFDLMLAEVHRDEGTVNQFLGDGIMALFGAPIAHEDHARRAVHAALGIGRALADYQRELAPRGIGFRARQGLNTGLVVVGRLQQAGEPGRVTISEATHRLVRGYFDTRPLGEMHLKGKAEPVAAWEVVAAHETRTRLEVEADRGLTPFVGRERELGQLLEAFGQAQGGHGQVALVIGDAGIGTSRLLLELRRRIGERADWREGHCLSFGRAMTLHPLVDLIRRQFAVEDTDGDFAAGIELSERAYELTNRSSRAGHGTGAERRAFIRNNEADAWMAQGDLAGAEAALDEAQHIVRHPPPSCWMTWRYSAHCHAGLGQLALLRGDPERARRLADQSLETAAPTSSRKYESWAWRIKGESATARRAWGEAEEALRHALGLAEEIGQPRQTWLGQTALGRLDAALGRRADARERYRAAWTIVTGLLERTRDPGLRAGLESSPSIREVEDLARP